VTVAARLAAIATGSVQVASLTLRAIRTHLTGDAVMVSMAVESNDSSKGKPRSEESRGRPDSAP
jgi:hypothetical protein